MVAVTEAAENAASLPALDRETLTPPVRCALGDRVAELLDWRQETLVYIVQSPIAGGVSRVTGSARTRGAVVPWSLVLKIARAPEGRSWPDGRVAPPGWGMEPSHAQYWRREAEAYRSGLLDDLPEGIVAPRCYGVAAQGDDALRLWLETIEAIEPGPWPLARYGDAARCLGRLNGAYLAGRPLPTYPWLNRAFLRGWTTDPARAVLTETITRAETWTHPLVRRCFPAPGAERLLRLIDEHEDLLAALDRLPQTLSHLDASSDNLLVRRDGAGRAEMVALDWAFVGIAAVGEEVGQLIARSLLAGAVPAGEAERLRAIVLAGYADGLRDAGWAASMEEIVRAVAVGASVAAALRWGLSAAVSAVRPAFDARARATRERNTGLPVAEGMARLARLASFLLDWLDATRPLLAAP